MTNFRLTVLATTVLLSLCSTVQARALHTDSAGDPDGVKSCTYVGDDPANKIDPTGKDGVTLDDLGYSRYGPVTAKPGEAQGAIEGAKALPGVMLNVALDSAPVIGVGRAAINMYEHPSWVNAAIMGASLIDLGGAAKVAKEIGLLERGAASLEKKCCRA